MPEGDDIVHYTTDAQQGTQSSWTQVPKRYVNDPNNPQCIITIDLQGHSLHSTYVAVAPSVVRAMAASLITKCLELNQGGVRTYGLGNTINEMLIVPTSYDDGSPIDIWGDRSRTISPDSTVESSDGADSVMLVPPGGYDVPTYMTITISGPVDRDPEENDLQITYLLTDYLLSTYIQKGDNIQIQDSAASLANGLISSHQKAVGDPNVRWWEFSIATPTPRPQNVKYQCEANLGVPSIANCEGALFQYIESGSVEVDPGNPIIKTAGNCAISVSSSQKTTTSWDLLRKVAEYLVAICISNPIHSRHGGIATSNAISNHGKRQASPSNPLLPSSLSLAVYYQSAFTGPAAGTCAWDIVANHSGDVRQCPATAASEGPLRPPDRSLLDPYKNTTLNVSLVEAAGLPLSAVKPYLPPASLVAQLAGPEDAGQSWAAGNLIDGTGGMGAAMSGAVSSTGMEATWEASLTASLARGTGGYAVPSPTGVGSQSGVDPVEASLGGVGCEVAC